MVYLQQELLKGHLVLHFLFLKYLMKFNILHYTKIIIFIFKFIFDSNFTTNESLTQISGRGVGLTSVKIELEKLNGSVEVKTEVNKGTSFIFLIPLIIE